MALEESYRQLQREFDEFQADSRLLEQELQKEIELRDETIANLKSRNERLSIEKGSLVQKYSRAMEEKSAVEHQCLQEIAELRQQNTKQAVRIVELEETVERLERTVRIKEDSAMAVEEKLNSSMERNAFLELEIEGHRAVEDDFQRLKMELRDLKEELDAKNAIKIIEPLCDGVETEGSRNSIHIITEINAKIEKLQVKLGSCRELVIPLIKPD